MTTDNTVTTDANGEVVSNKRTKNIITSQLTKDFAEYLISLGVPTTVPVKGNTLKFQFKNSTIAISARETGTGSGIHAGRASRFTQEMCLEAVISFVKSKFSAASKLYTKYVETQEKDSIPSYATINNVLTFWPASAIQRLMLKGVDISTVDYITVKTEYDAMKTELELAK